MSKAMDAAYGFDFGTSNSSIARFSRNKPHLVELQSGRSSIPTAIFFSYEDGGGIHFGRDAVERYLLRDEGRLMRALKSILGSPLYDETTYVRAQRVSFAEIITHFIKFVREKAGPADRVVMGRPVHFVDDDPEADARAERQLHDAARSAGYDHVEFQFEPIAAALDYEQTVRREELALVIDIGGGTSDFSIVRVSPERARRQDRKSDILAYSGVHVGGTDFDRLLSLATVMPFLGFKSLLKTKNMNPPSWYYHDLSSWARINMLYEGKVATEIIGLRRESMEPDKINRLLRIIELRKGHELLGQVEDTKIKLSAELDTALASVAFEEGKRLKVTRAKFEKSVSEAMARIDHKIRDTVKMAGLAPAELTTVFLTGGSSSIPMLRAIIAAALPASQIVEGDAFGSVATGLAIDAHRRFGA
jgi:hypothetical chaperone protein